MTRVDRPEGGVVLSLGGELDLCSAEQVRGALLDARSREPAVLVVDLEDVRSSTRRRSAC